MTTFTQLGIHQDLLGALETLGFQIPTPVQALAIPYALKSQEDLIVVAQTGTGKTASFALPLLTHLTQNNKPQGLILAPTRELALQITKDIKQFTQHMSWVNSVTVYGGADIHQQIKKLQRGAHVIVATPGRLLDLHRRGHARLNDIQYLILDTLSVTFSTL